MKYRVILTRNVTESAFVDVDVDSEDAAGDAALEQEMSADFKPDEGNFAKAYVSSVEPIDDDEEGNKRRENP